MRVSEKEVNVFLANGWLKLLIKLKNLTDENFIELIDSIYKKITKKLNN